eukprot:6205149-Pleurochrysis_carterae.AAC.1
MLILLERPAWPVRQSLQLHRPSRRRLGHDSSTHVAQSQTSKLVRWSSGRLQQVVKSYAPRHILGHSWGAANQCAQTSKTIGHRVKAYLAVSLLWESSRKSAALPHGLQPSGAVGGGPRRAFAVPSLLWCNQR